MKTYTIVKNDTLGAIAVKENVTVQQIVDINPGMKRSDTLQVGQVINLPVDDSFKSDPDINNGWQELKIPSIESTSDPVMKNRWQELNIPIEDYEVKRDNTYVKSVKVPCISPVSEFRPRPVKKIRISLFFDGTGNNKHNTELGKNKDNLKILKKIIHPEGVGFIFDELASFSNDQTNVVRLEESLDLKQENYDSSASIYIEGIGTKDNSTVKLNENNQLTYSKNGKIKTLEEENFILSALSTIAGHSHHERDEKVADIKDDFDGMSSGEGPTGIKKKSEKGMSELIKLIKNKCNKLDPIELITIDAFGFSRGAAAARYFLYLIKGNHNNTLYNKLRSAGFNVEKIDIKFVGLFDTVPAYESLGDDNKSYEKKGIIDDVKKLNLDIFKVVDVGKVVHLCAAEEYRNAFKLVNIKSALDKGNGIELFLPGAHSDVGGSYVNNDSEGVNHGHQILDLKEDGVKRYAREQDGHLTAIELLKIDKAWLKRLGWYNEGDITESSSERWSHFRLNVIRKKIKNTYSLIPLQIMHDYAVHDGGLKFKDNSYACVEGTQTKRLAVLQDTFNKDDLLRKVYEQILFYKETYCENSDSECSYWEGIDSNLWKKFRHDYLHFSSYFYDTLSKKDFGFLEPNLRPYMKIKDAEKIKLSGIRLRANIDG